MKKELRNLKKLKGGPNIVELITFVPDKHNPCFIFKYKPFTGHKMESPMIKDLDLRIYMYNLM